MYFNSRSLSVFYTMRYTMRFVGFSRAMRNCRGNPCISHVMKYTTGWESNGKKHSNYGKSMETISYTFPTSGVLLVFP